MQTPLVYGHNLYACKNNGILSCYDIRTGELHYRERLGDGTTGFTASPVAAAGRIYFTSEQGEVFVVEPGTEFKLLATNTVNEICMATPAISGGVLLIRGKKRICALRQQLRLANGDSATRHRIDQQLLQLIANTVGPLLNKSQSR